MDDLNISAAKCLRWKKGNIFWWPDEEHAKVLNLGDARLISDCDLEFTKSYDWSYLGLHEAQRLGEIGLKEGEDNPVLAKLWAIYDELEENRILSALELTEVWVKVIEATKENK